MKSEQSIQSGLMVLNHCAAERLEPRQLLSGSDALDRLNFGNLASEAAHHFDPGVAPGNLPVVKVGTVGASTGLTYRNPTNGQELIFTLADDPSRQNYFTVKFWGNDAPATVTLANAADVAINTLEAAGGAVIYPNRFYYYTYAIPITATMDVTSVQLHLDIVAPGKPVYSVFSSTNPAFVPDSGDATGTQPTMTGTATLTALTAAKAVGTTGSPGILLSNRQTIYGTNGTYSQMLARQITTANAPNAPPEVIGLDLFTNAASWVAANPNATADQWRQQIAHTEAGAGYTAFPDELLSMLTSTYLLQPFADSNGNTVTGLDDYHDPSLITRIVSAIDGASYEQDLDGGFIQQGADAAANSAWTGLTSATRTTGAFTGSSARQYTTHGGGDLQGFDTYALGWSLLSLLNDATAAPILTTYLNQSYNANLNGTPILRATAYERILYNAVQFYQGATGGTESQNMFQESAMYACDVALAKLQSLYPNSAYPANSSTALTYIKELMGLIQDTNMRGIGYDDNSPYAVSTVPNYGLTLDGFGEAHGAISTGFDGGGYGQMLPSLAPRIVQIATWDTTIDAGTLASFETIANNTINSLDQFFLPMDNAAVNSSGVLTGDTFSFNAEPYITYRDAKNLNVYAGTFNFDAQYPASNPAGSIDNAYALRAAYLETQYSVKPIIGFTGGYTATSSLDFLRNLPAYESTIRSLINVNPSTLTPLSGEPGQPDFAFADVQAGAVAIVNHGDRLYVNLDWRNYEYNNNTFVNIVPSQQARFDYSNGATEIAGQVLMPSNSATVQSDGNLTGLVDPGTKVLRFGNYLLVLNSGTKSYNAALPVGTGLVEDLISHNVYSLSASSSSPTTVSVAAGMAAIFWLNTSSVVSPLATGVDIGAVGLAGSDSYINGLYTLTGAGADIGETADAFHFVALGINSNETIAAQVLSQTATSSLAQAGVMLRDGTSANAAFAAVVRTPGGGVRFVYRNSAGAMAAWVAMPDPLSAVYVKLTRSGNNLSGYYSTDGLTWTQIGSAQTITMSAPEIGLVVSSHSTGATSTATFGNVSLNTAVAPTVATAASTSTTTVTGNLANLSVLGDDAGGEAGLTYTWALSGAPPDQVAFSVNGTNAAKNTTVTFKATGTYNFVVIIQNSNGACVANAVSVTVVQTATSVAVTAVQSQVANGLPDILYATVADQFGHPLLQPATVTWSISSGIGSVDQSGTYTASASGVGTAVVKGTYGALSATSTLTVVPYAAAAIWNLNGNYNDSSGYSHTVTGVNSPTFTTGVANQAMTLNGTSQYAQTSSGVLNTSQPFSVAAWVNWNGNTGFNTAVSQDGNTVSAFFLQYRGDTHQFSFTMLGADSASSSTLTYTAQYATASVANTWYYLIGVYTGSAIELFVNGFLAATTAFSGAFSASRSTVVGAAKFTSRTDYFHGSIEEVQLFSHALASSDVANLYGNYTATTIPFIGNIDIGSPSPAGTYSQAGSIITMTSGGTDIWGSFDTFTGAFEQITGNVTVTAQVLTLSNTNASAKAGVMIRNTLDSGSANVLAILTPGTTSGVDFQWRSTQNGSTNYINVSGAGIGVPYWVRLVRSGNSFSAYYSSDGTSWTQMGATQTISMNATVYVGLAQTSHVSGTASTATYQNVSISGSINTAPTVTTAAAASPATVTGTAANLSVLGGDEGGTSNLTYTWSLMNLSPSNVTFSNNGTSTAGNTTATFSAAGTYVLQVTITDTGGLSVISLVSVVVNQTLTSIVVWPVAPALGPSAAQQLTAIARDQFGNAMASQPSFTWTSTGSGSASGSGLYTAGIFTGSATVKATSGSVFGTAAVTVTNQAPIIATSAGAAATVGLTTANLSVPTADDGGAANLTYTWSATGPAAVTYSDNSTNAAQNTTATFTSAGTYLFNVTVYDAAGLSITSNESVVVVQTPTTLNVNPTPVTLAAGTPQQFGAIIYDQFGQTISSPPTVSWSATGGAINSSTGLYTASQSGGTYTISATSGSVSGNASVTVVPTVYSGSNYYLRLASDGSTEQIWVGSTAASGSPTYSIAASQLTSLAFTTGGGDSLTVDLTNGKPVPVGGVSLNGATTGSLIVDGNSAGNMATINASSVVYDGSAAITFTNTQSITLNGGAGADTLTQSAQPLAALTFDGGAGDDTLNINAGSYTFSGDASLTTSNLTINAANVGSLVTFYDTQHLAGLNLSAGAIAVLASVASSSQRGVLVTGSLSISNATLDLTNNDMVIHNGDLTALTSLVDSGYNTGHGRWNGLGINSSSAATNTTFLTTLAIIQSPSAGTFDSQSIVTTDVLLKYTYYGDTNLDGKVDGSDYSRIDSGFLTGATDWYNGDFNYDGMINGSDYTLIDNAFNTQGASLAAVIAAPTTQLANFTTIHTVPASERSKSRTGIVAIPTFSSRPISEQSFQDTQPSSVDAWTEINADSLKLKRRRSWLI